MIIKKKANAVKGNIGTYTQSLFPVAVNQILNKIFFLITGVLFSLNIFAADMPLPQAGSFYPIYNSGVNNYFPPTEQMPFDSISTLYIAFAHVYPDDKTGAVTLTFEKGQPEEAERLALLVKTARKVNPDIKIIISLGWGKTPSDWLYINMDYTSGENNFPKSIINFIRANHLDGFDIDDESVCSIPANNFDSVINNIRKALDTAESKDNKDYYFTITPASYLANINKNNMHNFDMINVQNYGQSNAQLFINLGMPKNKITVGVNTEASCSTQTFPSHKGLAGIFNWSLSADSNCQPPFVVTKAIAKDVGYHPKPIVTQKTSYISG